MHQTPEFEAIIKNCDKQRIVNFLKTIFPGKSGANTKFGGTEQGAADGITILGSVTLLTGDGRPKPVLCCAKQMDGMLTERSSRRRQFDTAVKILKGQLSTRYSGHGTTPVPFTQGLFFFFDEPGNFRLSLVTAEISAGKMELNNYRRQSFFVEAGKNNKTFRTRLCKAIANYDELKSAFDVEKLSDEFFREYKVFYEDIVQSITGARYIEVKKNKYERKDMSSVNHEIYDQFEQAYGEGAERAVRNYVKKLMGRLVFIQFLQKKGWLGNPMGSNTWNSGDRDFMQSLFLEVPPEDRENFIDNILEEIFFGEFNTKENERHIKNATLKKYRFPFLNCGLFDRDADDKLDFKLPAAVFCNLKFSDTERKAPNIKDWTQKRNPYFDDRACGLFDFFDRFNFTIDENDPTDAEVSVDPEMLGKIFENLLEDNKDKGAFYTPKEIVNYMVNESLIAYLGDEPKIRNFVLTQDSSAFTDNEKEQLDTKLAEVKICDPAIGSGAFPMGLLNLLCKCRQSLQPAERQHDKKMIAALKRDIIQQNIYGVDIEKGAVDIARLRFWLSLIVDEDTPEVLPNLEFKIMQGNSLLESYEGIDLSGLAGEKGNRSRAQSKDQLSLVFNEKQAIEQIQKDLNKFYKTDSHAEKESLTQSINNGVKSYIKFIAPQKSKEIDAMPVPNDKFFLWHTYFRDVFNRKGKEGFDIVIGNPPYISSERQVENNILNKQRETLKKCKLFKSLFQKWDLYIPFIELGTQLNCSGGITSMIVPYPLTNQLYAKVMRKMLVEEADLFELVDLNGTKIFENATVSNCIPFIRKAKSKDQTWISNIDENFQIHRVFEQPHSKLVQDNKTYLWNLTQDVRETDRHADLHVLGDYCYVSYGLRLNSDEKTAKGEFKKADLLSKEPDDIHCRKIIEGKDLEKYHVKKHQYVEWGTTRCPSKLVRPTFSEFYDHPKLFCNYLGDLTCMVDYENNFIHTHLITGCVLWKYLHGVENKSILSSIKKFSTMTRQEMERLSESIDLRYLLGILNSSYASILLSNIRSGDYHIYPEHIRNIPIPSASKEKQKPIIDLVDSILAEKKKDPAADTSKLEEEIDKLVYDLYDLLPEEIAIVKGDSSPSAQNDKGAEVRNKKMGNAQGSIANEDFLQGEEL